METITWTEQFETGVPELDEQHQKIVELLNQILSAPRLTTDSELVSDALTDMTRYAKQHFKTEETFLEKKNFPYLDEQKRQHAAYWKKTVELCRDTMNGSHTVPEELGAYLRDWWVNHILIEDMKYRDFAESQQS